MSKRTRAILGMMAVLAGREAVIMAADPTCTITLGPRTACMTPLRTRQGRADGGLSDVRLTSSNVLEATLTGTTAANAFLGCESAASETFHVEQDFEVAGPGVGVHEVAMTMESALVGLVRSKSHAAASARLASAKICPVGSPSSPLVMAHPAFEVAGTAGRLCNQRLAPIKVPAMPDGRYVLIADFVITANAAGLVDDHSAADFSPSTVLPGDWVRSRDPFQGVDKKDFGFKVTLTVDPVGASLAATTPARTLDPRLARTATSPVAVAPTRAGRAAVMTGIDRHSTPH